jgi:hypothetical protein
MEAEIAFEKSFTIYQSTRHAATVSSQVFSPGTTDKEQSHNSKQIYYNIKKELDLMSKGYT